ncbi:MULTISPECIES: ABC transporter ATP-binding protein [unclassified Clostridium]|uniref:ABC transporter ATP-binding protein n=1 Tax=unclassified Clostridium TaxID=2614128 RepID=UPI0025BA3A69|nr:MULTISPECIES: ABC transporter ATP-binding protein [unclassified Clostridium]
MAKNSINQDEKITSRSNSEIFLRLIKYLKPFRAKVFFIIFLMIIIMISGLLTPYLLKISIDKFIGAKNIKGLIMATSAVVIINFIGMLSSRISIIEMSKITNKILLNIRQELYNHIQKLSFAFFDERPVGKILARVIGDVNSLAELFSSGVTTVIPQFLTVVCVAVLMFTMNAKLAVLAIIVLPILCFTMFSIETISRKKWQIYRQKRSNMNGYTHEAFSGVRIIQDFTYEKTSSDKFKFSLKEMLDGFMKAIIFNDFFWPIVEVSWGISTLIIFWYGTKFFQSREITVGTIVAFISYSDMFWRPIINLASYYNTLITNFAAAERIFDIMDVEPDIIDLESAEIMPKIKGNVEFKNVTFEYEEGTPVLKDVSFKIRQGENIALVGPTGAGKTTITSLVSRFYDCNLGEVLIDGKNVKDVNLYSLRSQMGIMLQDTFLFSDTIKENIRYGKLDATDEEIIAAAKAVNAHEFIMKLEDGYDTEVNERGSRLSVGQRQLISFARALLANPRILILDEATSNIDTATEILVQKGINKLLKGRTSFVIAHRLSTIRDCNKIMVIDDGKIIEAGTHDELMAKKGFYYGLYMAQYRFLNEGA